jgi:hypothetical protein
MSGASLRLAEPPSPPRPAQALESPGAMTSALPTDAVPLPRLGAIARHAVPNLVECTLVPTLIFSVALQLSGLITASLAALGWSYAMLVRRIALRIRLPGLLLLTCLGLTVRTVVVVASGSAFVYFLQPIAATAVVGLTFLASCLTRSPMVDRLAKDFCPLTSDMVARHRVQLLFRRLTLMWAGVNLLNAAVTCWLLLTQSVAVFVAVKPLSAMAVTWSAVAVTVLWSLRVARQEGFATPGVGRLTGCGRVPRVPAGRRRVSH